MKKLSFLFFLGLIISNASFGSSREAVVKCVKQVYAILDSKGTGHACANVKTDKDVEEVVKCARETYSTLDSEGTGLACAHVSGPRL